MTSVPDFFSTFIEIDDGRPDAPRTKLGDFIHRYSANTNTHHYRVLMTSPKKRWLEIGLQRTFKVSADIRLDFLRSSDENSLSWIPSPCHLFRYMKNLMAIVRVNFESAIL
jgi:hypothetical protein